MPTPVRITGAFVGNGGAFGPISYGGKLFVVALSAYASTASDASEISLFISEDNGETWAQAGTPISIPSAEDAGGDIGSLPVRDAEWLHGCLDVDFPTEPYAYILHSGMDGGYGALHVSRLNFDTEDFDDTSAPGPSIPIAGSTGQHDFTGWMIEQATDREFGILANINTAGFDTDRVYAMSLSANLGSWSGRAQVSGQTSGIAYTASSIARGTDGRVHGFIEAQDGDQIDMYHTVVIGGGGGVGSALELVAEGEKMFWAPYTASSTPGGDIAFLFSAPAAGVGSGVKLAAAHAASADSPSFTVLDVDTSPSVLNSYYGALDGSTGTFKAAYGVNNTDDILRTAQYGGGVWGASFQTAVDDAYFISARPLTGGGMGVTFGQFLSGEDQLWYVVLASPGGVPDAYSQWVTSGRYGPWEWGGALYSVVFGNVAADQDNDYDFVPQLKLIKSTDGGETWTDVASETIDFADDVLPEDFAYAPETFGTCQDVDFATNGYVYVAYPGTDNHLYAKRLSLDDEAFIDTSAQGPDLVAYSDSAADVGALDPPCILIEQNTDGKFALMWQRPAGVAVDPLQVYIVDLAADLSAWGTATKVNGQSLGKAYSPYALLRGGDQRIHGLLWERDGTALALYHTLVLNTSGSLVGTTWDSVWAETHASGHAPGILNGAPVACLSYDAAGTQTLVVLYTDNQGVGIGGPYYRLRAAIAASANTPSWSHSTVYDDSATSFFYTATLTQAPGGEPLAVFAPIAPKGDLASATWNGSTWDAGASYDFTAERLAATPDGLWFIRQAETGYDTEYSYPLYFDDLSTITGGGGGGDEQILTGSTIATGERFYNTSGVTGGGIDGCGSNVPVVADNSCNPVDPDTAIDAPAVCTPQGFSY